MLTHASSEKSSPTTRLARSTLLLRRLHAVLQGRGGKAPTYIEMEEWTGVAEGTIKDWFSNQGRPSAEFLISLMERVPGKECHEIIESAFRCLPSLEDPRLKCDLTAISQLRSIAGQKSGITFVQGGTGEARTYLVSALGNAFLACSQRPCCVAGFDVHEPDWFVPVPGVNYLCNLFQPESLRAAIRQGWPQLGAGRPHLIILNGLWSALPEMQNEILKLAVRFPVIVADATIPRRSRSRQTHALTTNFVCVSPDSQSRTGFFLAINTR